MQAEMPRADVWSGLSAVAVPVQCFGVHAAEFGKQPPGIS